MGLRGVVMVPIIVAVIGWLLFIIMAVLYWVGNKSNSEESTSLALFSLALLLSDEFRSGSQEGYNAAIHEALARGTDPKAIGFSLVQAVTENAKRLSGATAEVNTSWLLLNAIEKKRS